MTIVKSYCYLGVDVVDSGTNKTARTNMGKKHVKLFSPFYQIKLLTFFNLWSDQLCFTILKI